MFERRLKILLGGLAFFTLVLLLRAGWLQVVQGSEYQKRALESGRRSSYIETARGAILDFRGRKAAEDAPCIDAAVDYRAIDWEAKESQDWLRVQAKNRLAARQALRGSKEDRDRLTEVEVERLKDDYRQMWQTMAEVSGKTPDDIEEIKSNIVRRVQLRRRYVWYKRYEEARQKHESDAKLAAQQEQKWYSWMVDDRQAAPQLDSFKVTVAEQTEAHPVLHDLDNDAYIKLDRLRERCPGLELRKGTHRRYPYADIGCHVLGNLAPVMREDLERERASSAGDESKAYFYNDYIGRSGIERMAERDLRGSRGRIVRQAGSDKVIETVDPAPGRDVTITVDLELQMRIHEAFLRYRETEDKLNPGHDLRVQQMPVHEMHGAAVVIDVPTGQVRALVSYPTYDLNQFQSLYPSLVRDQVNQPLLNRATQATLEPGSTVKPMVGLSAITAGVLGVNETIECTGYLIINGVKKAEGRCWTESKFGHLGIDVSHHRIPSRFPHPTGFLTFADALERSCNVFFENCADRLKMEGLRFWMGEFGLGHLTEIGIPESAGRIPGEIQVPNWRSATWFSGIGQSQVLATPLQMANVAATIARRGIWVRPHLLVEQTPDVARRDLHLNPAAIDAAFAGMINVVNSPGGTGTVLHRDDVLVAGKTGTAQAAVFNLLKVDEAGKPMRDERGHLVREFFDPSTPERPNREMPWYRGSVGPTGKLDLNHAWFIGFAPADKPQIAFAVLVEYGGSGGKDAGPVAQAILDACIEHGYLSRAK
jgi:penicillin-binding protein 2